MQKSDYIKEEKKTSIDACFFVYNYIQYRSRISIIWLDQISPHKLTLHDNLSKGETEWKEK
jgi:hypothetical protein